MFNQSDLEMRHFKVGNSIKPAFVILYLKIKHFKMENSKRPLFSNFTWELGISKLAILIGPICIKSVDLEAY